METKKKKKRLPVDDTATMDTTAVIEPVDSTSPENSQETTPAPTADTEEVAITAPTTVENTNDAPTLNHCLKMPRLRRTATASPTLPYKRLRPSQHYPLHKRWSTVWPQASTTPTTSAMP